MCHFNLDSDCRIYVCKSTFAAADECIKFETFDAYKTWLTSSSKFGMYSFQPICHTKEIFDRMILSYRSGKIKLVSIQGQ